MSSNSAAKDVSIPILKANLYMFAITIPLIGLLALIFSAVWDLGSFLVGTYRFLALPSVVPALLIGVPLHEFLHALGWVYFGKKSFKEIKFGFQWKTITPYAHLTVPVSAWGYRMGTVLPGLVLGLLPYLAGLISGNGWLGALGLFFIFAAGGDLLALWIIRKVKNQTVVIDHPSQVGCLVLETEIV